MAFNIFEYIHTDNTYPFTEWCNEDVEKSHLAKLNRKIDSLRIHGESLRPETLSDCGVVGLAKLRVRGNVQLRPLLCHVEELGDYVLLKGAKEIQSRWVPSNARNRAAEYKALLLGDYQNRKRKYERRA